MVYHAHDAEDVTQEVQIKPLTKLSTFEGRSRFRTWLYRIGVNHVLNMKRARCEAAEWTFQKYGDGLDNAPDAELPDPRAVPVDVQLPGRRGAHYLFVGHAPVPEPRATPCLHPG